jgi:hypothetical protein
MSICTKTAKRLHILKLLKRAAMSTITNLLSDQLQNMHVLYGTPV